MKFLLATCILAGAVARAQTASPPPQTPEKSPQKSPAPASTVRQLSDDEIREAVEKQKVFLLDVREPNELETLGTVKGYVNIPLGQLESRLGEIPKDKLILTL